MQPAHSSRPASLAAGSETPPAEASAEPATGHDRLVLGLALAAALAAVATLLARAAWFPAHGLSGLSLAIVTGMLLGNTVYPRFAAAAGPGVGFTKQRLLRLAVVLYGFRITLADVGHAGFAAVVIDALVLSSTFLLAYVAGTRLLGLDRVTSMLVGAGGAICGAAAILATEPVVRGRAEQVTVAVAGVVLFGTLGIFLYPALYALNAHWGVIPAGFSAFGIYAGSTIHEVAQVFAAGRSISIEVANIAVITKMVRVMMLAPFLLCLSALQARDAWSQRSAGNHVRGHARRAIPWFALCFIAVVGFNSSALCPPVLARTIVPCDTFLLAMAMAALGLTTHFSVIRRAGAKPLLLALILWGWLIAGGALINRLVGMALA